MHFYGSLIQRVPQGSISAILIATKVGMSCEFPASIAFDKSQLMRTGRRSDFAKPSSSTFTRDSHPAFPKNTLLGDDSLLCPTYPSTRRGNVSGYSRYLPRLM